MASKVKIFWTKKWRFESSLYNGHPSKGFNVGFLSGRNARRKACSNIYNHDTQWHWISRSRHNFPLRESTIKKLESHNYHLLPHAVFNNDGVHGNKGDKMALAQVKGFEAPKHSWPWVAAASACCRRQAAGFPGLRVDPGSGRTSSERTAASWWTRPTCPEAFRPRELRVESENEKNDIRKLHLHCSK